jgi:hypothetical protein
VRTLSVVSLLNSTEMARELLFDSKTAERLVKAAAKRLVPTSFFAYGQLTTRFLWHIPFIWLTRPKIVNDGGGEDALLQRDGRDFSPLGVRKDASSLSANRDGAC